MRNEADFGINSPLKLPIVLVDSVCKPGSNGLKTVDCDRNPGNLFGLRSFG